MISTRRLRLWMILGAAIGAYVGIGVEVLEQARDRRAELDRWNRTANAGTPAVVILAAADVDDDPAGPE